MLYQYPKVKEVKITDKFWAPYLKDVRYKMIPYVFAKMEETGYFKNFLSVAQKKGEKHLGPPFSDGLFLESLRGVCDFLAHSNDPILETYVENAISVINEAAKAEGGFLCTATTQDYPEKRFGDNGGFLFWQHDLYNHGTLIEAAISHYNTTGKTHFLETAVNAANLICNEIGKPPKKNYVPGHSLVEEAFVKLYRLFRDDRNLDELAKKLNVNFDDYLEIAEFWYDARGNYEGRTQIESVNPDNYQDHLPFAQQREAVGHSVRAMLCYLGATSVTQEKQRDDFKVALNAIWDNVIYKKLHISGGIGARHDIEGFAEDYNLPNKAYLETCAAIALAFWNAEMNILQPDSKYFDYFERSLYNNIISAIGADFNHFFYQNPLEADGSLHRWEWHITPCCPAMLLKILSSLCSYIYSYNEDEKAVCVNMLIDSEYKNSLADIKLSDNKLYIDSFEKEITLKIRIPEYVKGFLITNGHSRFTPGTEEGYILENGYAVIKGVFNKDNPVHLFYRTDVRRIFANPLVEEELGKVAVSYGPFIYCIEGYDNGGRVDFTLSDKPDFKMVDEFIYAKTADDLTVKMLPYYKWNNRGCNDTDAKMTVWINQANMKEKELLAKKIGEKLYDVYE